nr:hypothetical protein [Alphaproteobacteria bacterium]
MASKIRNFLSKLFKKEEEVPLIDRLEDLMESDPEVTQGIEADETGELTLVSNVLGLKDLTAKDVMVPRADIVAASVDSTLEEFIDILSQNNFSQ